ncbi:MAG: hypothetical protein QXJ25_03640 [Candidatus Aenigmatarchaeota archaeon]
MSEIFKHLTLFPDEHIIYAIDIKFKKEWIILTDLRLIINTEKLFKTLTLDQIISIKGLKKYSKTSLVLIFIGILLIIFVIGIIFIIGGILLYKRSRYIEIVIDTKTEQVRVPTKITSESARVFIENVYLQKRKLLLKSSWDKNKEEIRRVYENVGEPVYAILKAFLELKEDLTNKSSCKYNTLFFRAEELIGTSRGLKKALDGLQAKGIVKLYRGNVEISSEFVPLIKEIVEEIEHVHTLKVTAPVLKQESVEIPEDIFDTVIGYDDVKKLFLMSLKAEKPTHILLVGPPASAKTVMLLEISRLKDAFYVLGGSTTKVGLIDQLFDLRPKYVLLDEADKMDKEDYTALLSLMETGIVKEVKHDKTREIILPAKVYAACNNEKYLPPEILSRFQFRLHFKPYTKEEFIEVSKRVLIMREGLDEELATYISERVAELTRDVRESIGIARLAKTKDEVDFLLNLKRKYTFLNKA